MGSKTLLSLPNAMPLKNRTNIVITNQKEKYSNMYKTIDNILFLELKETLDFMKTNISNKFFIIGGNQIYNELLPYCSTIWLTKIKQSYDCDLIFNYDISTYTKEIIYEDTELEIMCVK
jgi:dihydrofolate reductase